MHVHKKYDLIGWSNKSSFLKYENVISIIRIYHSHFAIDWIKWLFLIITEMIYQLAFLISKGLLVRNSISKAQIHREKRIRLKIGVKSHFENQ